jgi:hypothetical protein
MIDFFVADRFVVCSGFHPVPVIGMLLKLSVSFCDCTDCTFETPGVEMSIQTSVYRLFIVVVVAIKFSLGGSSPFNSTDKTNKNKFT